jgi:hypothetical protein
MPWEDQMAKPNYQFEKRQRDLAKKKKKEEKLLKKQQAKGVEGIEGTEGAEGAEGAAQDAPADDEPTAAAAQNEAKL